MNIIRLFKIIALIAVAVMIIFCFAGCVKTNFGNTRGVTDTDINDSATSYKQDEPRVIKAYFIENDNKSILENFGEIIKEHTNIELQVVEAAYDSSVSMNRAERIIMMGSLSGENISWVTVSSDQPFKKWGEQGFLNDLAPCIEEYKSELPIINSIVNSVEFEQLKGENGEIYVIPATDYITTVVDNAGQESIYKTIPTFITEEKDVFATLKFMEWAHSEDAKSVLK